MKKLPFSPPSRTHLLTHTDGPPAVFLSLSLSLSPTTHSLHVDLDDMPAIGYAVSSLEADRIEKYLLLLYGHAANYQGRGSFFSTEQMSLYQDTSHPQWRASLGEIQADFCTPSQTLIASMTAMQYVYAERDNATVWLAKAAPRRWFSDDIGEHGSGAAGELFGVRNAPSRWGNVSFSIVSFAKGIKTKTYQASFYCDCVTTSYVHTVRCTYFFSFCSIHIRFSPP